MFPDSDYMYLGHTLPIQGLVTLTFWPAMIRVPL